MRTHGFRLLNYIFFSARTRLEQRTEVVVTYLKGAAIQWWRGTGYVATNMAWHIYYSYLTDMFAEFSISDNVRAFHALTQTSTISV